PAGGRGQDGRPGADAAGGGTLTARSARIDRTGRRLSRAGRCLVGRRGGGGRRRRVVGNNGNDARRYGLPPDLLLEALVHRVRFLAFGEIADVDEPADLELTAVPVQPEALHPLHHFVDRLRLHHPVAADELLGLGERTVGDLASLALQADALALAARPQAARVEENARLHHFLVELHRLHDEILF